MNQELRSFIREVIEEARKPKPFDMDHFRSLKKFDDMNEYLDFHARVIGSGIDRTVYDVGSDQVIKMVHNDEDVAQNKREATIGDCSKNAPVPNVVEAGPKLVWIVVEKVKPLSTKQLNSMITALTGIDEGKDTLRALQSVLSAGTHEAGFRDEADNEIHERLYKKSDWYRSLFDMFDRCELAVDELHGANWGLTAKDKLVVLDTGV